MTKITLITTSILFLCSCGTKNKEAKRISVKSELKKSMNKTSSCVEKSYETEALDQHIDNLKPSSEGLTFNFNFLETSISEAFLELSLESGVPIVFGENISGTVSLNIAEKSFEEVLAILVKTGPFEYKKYDGYYYIGILDPGDNSWEQVLYSINYKLKFIKASNIEKSINAKVNSLIKYDSQSNKIFIRAPRSAAIEVLEHIKKIDKPRKQVRIQLTILELSKKGSRYIGKKFSTGTLNDYENNNESLLEAPTLLSQSKYLSFLYSIKALQQRGLAKVRATPTIITMEEKPAMFKTTNKALLNVPQIRLQSRAEFVEFGTLFQIIPFIVNKDTIRLKIKDSYSSSYNPDTFTINEHKLDTEVEVKHGESLLIGGMIYNKKERVITKVPVLGDIPLIGAFFKGTSKKTETVEVLFSIRPKIECL